MSKALPVRPNLEHLRKQAKRLLKELHAGNPAALDRALKVLPGRQRPHSKEPHTSAEFQLTDAQLILAREYDFPSWNQLKVEMERRSRSADARIAHFIRCATGDRFPEAAQLLAQEPGLATADPYAACVAGSHETVEAALAEDPEFALTRGGPENTFPLIHTCFSGFLRHDPVRAKSLVAIARLLLAHGADPNAIVLRGPSGEPWRLSALYGAAGRANHAGMTRLLLEAGANPNDNESLYHAAEFQDHACLKLLLDHGAIIPGSNVVHRKLDYDDLEGLRLLLDCGADPNLRRNGNDEPLLHWAIKNRRRVEFLQLLADRGADLHATDGHGNTAFQLATRAHHPDAIRFLQERGAASPMSDSERQWLFLMQATSIEITEALRSDPDLVCRWVLAHPGALVHLAWDLQREAVARLLDLGFPVEATDHSGTTALHNACWKGDLALVRLLLKHHPPLEAVERRFGATPLSWAIHGFQNAKNAEGDYVNPEADYPGVIRALMGAGARVTPEMIKNAPAPLRCLITDGST